MVVLEVAVVASTAFVLSDLQEPEQGTAAVAAGRFVLHIEEVPGALQGAELAVLDVLGKLTGIVGRGVLVPFAVHKQHRYIDLFRCLQVAQPIAMQDLADMKVHLRIFMDFQGADMPVIEALEQGGQVFADGVIDQMPDPVTVAVAEIVDTTLEIVTHGVVDHRRERADHRFLDAPWALGKSHQGRGAAPGKRQHVFGGKVVDQLEQDLPLGFLGQHPAMLIVGLGLARIGLVVADHIEGRVQVLDGLGKRRGGGH